MVKLTFKKYRNVLFFIVNALFVWICVDNIVTFLAGYPIDQFYAAWFAIIAGITCLRDSLQYLDTILRSIADYLEEKVKASK